MGLCPMTGRSWSLSHFVTRKNREDPGETHSLRGVASTCCCGLATESAHHVDSQEPCPLTSTWAGFGPVMYSFHSEERFHPGFSGFFNFLEAEDWFSVPTLPERSWDTSRGLSQWSGWSRHGRTNWTICQHVLSGTAP